MTNIIKELEKAKEQRLSSGEEFVKQSQLLLGDNANKEAEILHAMGLDTHLNIVEHEREEAILNSKHEETYEMQVFNYKELKALGIKYRLRLAQSSLYRGVIPADIGAVVLRLKEKHNLGIFRNDGDHNSNGDRGKFMILAPPVMFKDYQTIGNKLFNALEDSRAAIKEFMTVKDPDPVLFYRVDSDHYILLKKWGKDFTPFRRVLGLVTGNVLLPFIGMLILPFLMLSIIGRFACWLWLHTPDIAQDKAGHYLGFPAWGLVCVVSYAILITSMIIFMVMWTRILFWTKKSYSLSAFLTQSLWIK